MMRFATAIALVAMMALCVYGGATLLFPSLLPAVAGLSATSNMPSTINHQGVVAINGVRFTGSGQFKFAIVDRDTGNSLWTNDGTQLGGTTPPTSAVTVTVADGIYSVALGNTSLTNMTAVPASIFNTGKTSLRIWFNDGTNGWQQLSPDHALTSVAYAFRAETVTDGAVTAVKLGSDVYTVPQGGIIMWSGSTGSIPTGWHLCDGTSGTPDLRGRFVVGAGNTYAVGATGGSDTTTVPGHYHSKGTLGTSTYDPGTNEVLRWCGPGCASDRTAPYGNDFRGGLNVAHSHAITGTVGNTGSSYNGDNNNSIENRPPYYAVCYIMKL